MVEGVPHAHPPRPWHDAAAGAVVFAQVFALARASSDVPPAGCAALALAAGVVALPRPRARSAVGELALRAAALLAAGGALLGLGAGRIAGLSGELSAAQFTAWLWVWALQAPLTMTRWWVRASPSYDAGLELAESAGASLVATVLGLTIAGPMEAWSLPLGTAWSTGLCLAAGAALLAGAWVAHARRRRWLRGVIAGDDPAWRVADDGEPAEAPAWAHAADDGAPQRALVPRGPAASYRTAEVHAPAARVGGDEEGAWRGRRALHAFSLVWAFAMVAFGPRGARHVTAELAPAYVTEAEVLRAIETLPAFELRTDEVDDRPLHVRARPGLWSGLAWRDERADRKIGMDLIGTTGRVRCWRSTMRGPASVADAYALLRLLASIQRLAEQRGGTAASDELHASVRVGEEEGWTEAHFEGERAVYAAPHRRFCE